MAKQVTIVDAGQRFKTTPAGEIPIDWESTTLADVCLKIQDGTHFSPKTKTGPRMYITSRNVRMGRLDLSDVGRISEDEHRDIYRRADVRYGDILLTKDGAMAGNVAINTLQNEFSLLSSVAFLRADPSRASAQWLFQFLASENGQQQIRNQISGQAITRLTLEKIRALSIALPPLSEQEKIAEVLSAADQATEKSSASIIEMRRMKEGLIQNLLVQRARQNNWKASSIGDCAQINAETLGEDTAADSKLQYIDISSVDDRGRVSRTKEIPFGEAPSRARRVVRSGDILVSTVRPYLRAFAKIDDAPANLTASTGFAVLSPRPTVAGEFLYQFIRSNRFVNFLIERMVGSNYPAVNAGDVAMCPIPLPPMDEQARIGEELLAIDSAISADEAMLHRLRALKAALMQDLLTGRKRVRS